MTGFAASVDAWAKETEARLLEIFKRACYLLIEELKLSKKNGGKVPYDLGRMADSLEGAINSIVATSDADPPPVGDPGGKVAMLELGDVLHLGYQAIYARRQNYGFVGEDSMGRTYNQEGNHFVEYAASMWPVMVQLANEELRNISA